MSDVTLLHGDCLRLMADIPAGSVDAVVTDPPYGQTNEVYDGSIAFGPDLWRECFRVAKPNAALISFTGSPTYHRIASAIEAGGWKVRQMWGWVYRDGFMTSAWPKEGFDRLAPAMDPICFATKGKVLLNLEREGDHEWVRDEVRRGEGGPSYSARSTSHGAEIGKGHWPRSITAEDVPGFEYFILSRTMGGYGWAKEKTEHPNQKPIVLMRWLVSKLPPGFLVLDPFSGCGSTAVACVEEGMRFIGIELNPEYHAMASRRIAKAERSMPLFVALPDPSLDPRPAHTPSPGQLALFPEDA
jgi:DNA modification methylase